VCETHDRDHHRIDLTLHENYYSLHRATNATTRLVYFNQWDYIVEMSDAKKCVHDRVYRRIDLTLHENYYSLYRAPDATTRLVCLTDGIIAIY